MSRRGLSLALTVGVVFGSGVGCFKADVRVPDVQVNTSDYGSGASSNERRMPYAKELTKVLDQQKGVEKELKQRDWGDLAGELTDWVKGVRKLMGKADTSKSPARMKEYCTALLNEMEAMQKATRAQDAKGVQAGLDRANPWLNRLSAEFPLSEPIPASEQRPAEKTKPAAAP